ncbi:Protein-lysine N-methyltransferase EFM3 [Mycena sanguinolenta]|uniref:Protein-lysine N-methyltransferase EFM3 n=1 Tax=Mycena sanguinolenta TaxID=230812 RepID=A0A8H6XAJ4_9AGAR|nr:Protein-lysine N-methyltransferase EFM3 [Mycena sanguinolenta]
MVCIHADLFQILRGYASLVPPSRLQFPSHLQTQVIHDFLVDHILSNLHFQTYPPSVDYQRSFWKWIIPLLEKTVALDPETEVDSRIYDVYLELLHSSTGPEAVPGLTGRRPPSQAYITHFWRQDGLAKSTLVDLDEYQTTTILESRTMIESGTTGLRTWLASLILAQYLILNPGADFSSSVKEYSNSVLEPAFWEVLSLPCSSWNAAQAQVHSGCQISTTLFSPAAVIMSTCIATDLSSSHPNTNCCFLDWSAALDPDGIEPLTSLLNDQIDPDVILGADIVFDPDLIPPLVAVLRLALQANTRSRSALIALTTRNPTTMTKFTDAVQDTGLILKKLDFEIQDQMFIESLECTGDTNNGVGIFMISSSVEQ